MKMEGLSRGTAGFTLLFFVFIAVFSIISLLMKHIVFLLFPMFGLALSLWRKGRKVNLGLRIALVIFSIGAVAYLAWFAFWWIIAISLYYLILSYALSFILVVSISNGNFYLIPQFVLWPLMAFALSVPLPVIIGYFAGVQSLGDSEPPAPFPPTYTPESFLKKCARCGKDIPIASEKCQHCESSQNTEGTNT